LLSSYFDRVVAVLGNSVFHLEILRLLLRHGGAAILHDGRMVDLYAGHMNLEKTVAMAEAELGRPLPPNEIWAWLAGDTPPAALILSEIAAAAEPLLMHSRAGIDEVGRRYGVSAVHLPFSLYRSIDDGDRTPVAQRAARARLAVAEDSVLVVSFGYVHASKAPVDCIWALDLLRSWGIPAVLHFVGAPLTPLEPLTALIAELGLGAHVHLPAEFIDERTYRDYLVAADLGIQLRVSGAGSVSGALADCIAAGLPTVASAMLVAALDAPDFIRPVPDSPSPVLVAEAARGLLGRPDTVAARQAYAASRGFDRYAATLCEALGLA
jgi:glycosyltransferase involved in cell wall biosynthesis